MARVPTITLWSGKEFVIVEPGGSGDKIWRSRGYVDKQSQEKQWPALLMKSGRQPQATVSVQEVPSTTLFPKKKRGRPKKVKDVGKTNYEKTKETS